MILPWLPPSMQRLACLVAAGWDDARMARALGTTEARVAERVAILMEDADVGDRVELAAWVQVELGRVICAIQRQAAGEAAK